MANPRTASRANTTVAGSGPSGRPGTTPPGDPGRRREPLPTQASNLPALPRAFHAVLEHGLARLGLSLDDRQRGRLAEHVQLLLAWNAAINLTAITDPDDVAIRHVLDSLTAVRLLRARGVDRLVDLGSGGGFPGLPLAVAVPLDRALLVESVGKKATFLRTVAAALGVGGVEVAAERAELVAGRPADRGAWPAVTARAVASLGELVELAFPLLARGGCLVAWKRGELEAELAAGRRAADALGGGTFEVVPAGLPELPDHRLVVVTRTGAGPSRLPRPPHIRKRAPW